VKSCVSSGIDEMTVNLARDSGSALARFFS